MTAGQTMTFSRDVPIRHEADVFVAGGGPAGVAAAAAAARGGCSVYLAEGQACLGGMGTSGLVPVFMQFTDGIHFLAGGIGREIHDELHRLGGIGEGSNPVIHPEVLKRVCDAILLKEKVDFSLMTQLIAVEKSGPDTVSAAILAAKSGIFAVKADIYIDCTGDGDLAAWAGADCAKGDGSGQMMAGTLCSRWSNIQWSKSRWEDQAASLEQAFRDGIFTVHDRHLPGIFSWNGSMGAGNTGHAFGLDGTDEDSLTEALVRQRAALMEYREYYRKYCPGFESAELIATASLMGVRETRRIRGDYELTLQDFISRASFEDEIGRYAYGIDIHESTPDRKDYRKFEEEYRTLRLKEGESYGIPYRILTPKGLRNVLTAGRCVSSDRYMQSSIRVMPACYITGQAAGAAAAAAVRSRTDTRGFDVRILQKALRDMGGYLPA